MECPSPSHSRAATFLPDHAQMALAIADGFGGEGQREAQQVHCSLEGIYLGGLGKKRQVMEVTEVMNCCLINANKLRKSFPG